MLYRKEVDGLRAIAVIPVILFHAGIPIFQGGFVGVDIFFVISGYLITSIILEEKENNRFSIVNFYERRARRILPALTAVLLFVTVAGWGLLTPFEYREYSQSLVSVAVFSSNVFFWSESGYFAPASEQLPLLHTWSLAVEEQYYLFFPILISLFWFLRKKILFSLILFATLVSLGLSQWLSMTADTSSASFYLIHTRAWELFIGSITAFVFYFRRDPKPIQNELLAWSGVALILYAMFMFDKYTPFPSLYALVPTVGTALVICFASEKVGVGRLIGNRLFVVIGLMSYSLYLWHQPIFAFLRIESFGEPEPQVFLIAIVIVFVLSWLSLKYIERPFRNKNKFSRRSIFILSAGALILIGSFGMLGHITNGFEERYATVNKELINTAVPSPKRQACHTSGVGYMKPSDACVYGGSDVRWAVLGDSHAVEFAYGFSSALEKQGLGVIHLSFSDCPPAVGFEARNPGCSSWARESIDFLKSRNSVENVVLIYRHSRYLSGYHEHSYPDVPDMDPRLEVMVDQELGSVEDARQLYMDSFVMMIDQLRGAGKKVFVVYPLPELPRSIKRSLYPSHIFTPELEEDLSGIVSTNYYLKRNEDILEKLDELDWGRDLIALDPRNVMCDENGCQAVQGNTSLYFDEDHLSVSGARIVAIGLLADFLVP